MPTHGDESEQGQGGGSRDLRGRVEITEDPGIPTSITQDSVAESDERGGPGISTFGSPVVPGIGVIGRAPLSVLVIIFDADTDEEVAKCVRDDLIFEGVLASDVIGDEIEDLSSGDRTIPEHIEEIGVSIDEIELDAGREISFANTPRPNQIGLGNGGHRRGRKESYNYSRRSTQLCSPGRVRAGMGSECRARCTFERAQRLGMAVDDPTR